MLLCESWMWLKGESGGSPEESGDKHRIDRVPVPRMPRYVDDSVRSGTSGSWSSSGLSNGVSFSLVGFLPDDLAHAYGGDYSVRCVAFRIACVPPPDVET